MLSLGYAVKGFVRIGPTQRLPVAEKQLAFLVGLVQGAQPTSSYSVCSKIIFIEGIRPQRQEFPSF